jgi:hypothetical protein
LAALLFPARTEQASFDFEHRAWAMFFVGLLAMGLVAFVGAVMFNVPNPVVRTVGAVLYGLALGVSVFGSGGLFRLIGRRVRSTQGAPGDYQAIARGGFLVVAAELLPFFGWFLLFPFVLLASFGAGLRAMFAYRERHSVEAPPAPEAP